MPVLNKLSCLKNFATILDLFTNRFSVPIYYSLNSLKTEILQILIA